MQLLDLYTWTDLERKICGDPSIDIDLLRRHTEYSGVSPDAPYIGFFWSVLESFDQETRRKFVKFCWAQERLPASDAEFKAKRTRMLIKAAVKASPTSLPRADTCFFNLELPPYKSEAQLREKLLYALDNVTTMDADEGVEDMGGNRQFDQV